MKHRPGNRLLAAAACAALALAASCAYYNTLYNARNIYRDAEMQSAKSGSSRELRDKYTQVVDKCIAVVQNYPKSRWVDDALFLMGQALVRQGEYDKAIRQFTEVIARFPRSEYAPRSLHWIAIAYDGEKDYQQAIVHVNRFLELHPRHQERFEAMFLAGDIHRDLGETEEALALYSRVASEASKREVVDEARLKSADLFYDAEDWDRAAAGYAKILRKGMPWETRFSVSLALGDCYAKTHKCGEALAIFDGLLKEQLTIQQQPAVELGRAASYLCMDSIPAAIGIYQRITKRYVKSTFSAEAYYRMGVIYHERLDSLGRAQEAFSRVAGEYTNSEFASASIQKAASLKRLMELQKATGGTAGPEQRAETKFLAAELQLTRFDNVDLALEGYRAVLDSFPETASGPLAAYAIGWIYQNRKADTARAVESYRALIERWPRSPQSMGARDAIASLDRSDLAARLAAYIDSALADTAAARIEREARERRERELKGASQAPGGGAERPVPALQDTLSRRPGISAPLDTLRRQAESQSPLDTLRRQPGIPAPPDTLRPTQPTKPDTSGGTGKRERD